MNWNSVPLDKLETLYSALGDYLTLRRRQTAAGQIQTLEQERRQVSLELDEARAQLAAQQELAGRLMAALKIGVNGTARPGDPTPLNGAGRLDLGGDF